MKYTIIAAKQATGHLRDDPVESVLFLRSHLSEIVVGHVLMVDGGWMIH